MFLSYYKRTKLFQRFHEVYILYEHAKEQIYENLYSSDIYIYHINNYRLNKDEDLNKLRKIYITNVINALGPSIVQDIEEIKGNFDSIILDLSNYFMKKLLEDENKIFTESNENDENVSDDITLNDMLGNIV